MSNNTEKNLSSPVVEPCIIVSHWTTAMARAWLLPALALSLGCATGHSPGVSETTQKSAIEESSPDVETSAPEQGDATSLEEDATRNESENENESVVHTGELLKETNLAYTPPSGVNGEMATLDITWLDDGVTKPLVVLVHGGSWVGGDKSNFESAAPAFIPWWLDRGYAVASVNFRLASKLGTPKNVLPTDQVSDIAHAIAWLHAQRDTFSILPDQIVLVGYSSGAHLVALLGADGTYLEEAGVEETILRATVSLDVHVYDVPYALELMVGTDVEQNIPLINHLFGETEEEQLTGSPIHHIDGWVAPTLIVSVDEDPAVTGSYGHIVSEAAKNYVSALAEKGHVAQAFHDITESHTTLATGFGMDGDAVTGTVDTFLNGLP